MIDSGVIKAAVAQYYRYKRQCSIVCFERSGQIWDHIPDVMVIDKKRRRIEIEVKVSLSDFRNDKKKEIWRRRNGEGLRPVAMPYQFYYAVPEGLVPKIQPELDERCGLLSVGHGLFNPSDWVRAVVRAPLHKDSPILTEAQMWEMVKHQTGTLCSLAEAAYINWPRRLREAKEQHKQEVTP